MFDSKKKQVEQQLLKPIRDYAINFEYEFSNDEHKNDEKNKFNSNGKTIVRKGCVVIHIGSLPYSLINLPQLVST
jgi:hypothetical protein